MFIRRIRILKGASVTIAALMAFAMALNFIFTGSLCAQEMPKRLRTIVLTDIGGDPDDQQSMVRFLLYVNEFDVEGLLATATGKNIVNIDEIFKRLDAYEQVRPNLVEHDDGYPTADALRAVTCRGVQTRFMTSVGDGRSTDASRHIITVVDKPDPRPVWIQVWGAATDLAQALYDVKQSRSPEEVDAFVSRLLVYDIAGQDDAAGWICHNFPGIFWIRSLDQFQAISVREARPFPPDVTGANIATFTTEWVDTNIQSHGVLGILYPERKWKYEGDTPAFLYLLPNGLSDPMQPHFGGWGGRFSQERVKNPDCFAERYTDAQHQWRDFWMFCDAADTWTYEEHTYAESAHAALFRWREAFQHDFAARMDWSITPQRGGANHNPVAAFRGEVSKSIVYLNVKSGERVDLSAAGSNDPDGDVMNIRWWRYPEPGTFSGQIAIAGSREWEASFIAPDVTNSQSIHIILELRDSGAPPLSAYRRIVVTVTPS